MIKIRKEPTINSTLFDGIIIEKILHEDEFEQIEHSFQIEIAIDLVSEEISLGVHWKGSEPENVHYYERDIFLRAVDELIPA